MKACYPRLYDLVRQEIASQAVELRPNLSIQQEVALSVLFDVPVSNMMKPNIVQAFQATFASAPAEPQSKQISGLNRKGTMASGFDAQEKST